MPTPDYDHCKQVQGTTSMCYNPYSQRGWIADINSKRDVAVEQLRNQLSTKTVKYYWSNSTSVEITPQQTSDPDDAAGSLSDVTQTVWQLARSSSMTGETANQVKPSSMEELFKYTNDAGTGSTAGQISTIQYVGEDRILVELKGSLTYTRGTTAKDLSLGFQLRQSFTSDWEWLGFEQKNVTFADAPSAVDEVSVTAEVSIITELDPNNVIGLFCWNSSSAVALNLTEISQSIVTLPF